MLYGLAAVTIAKYPLLSLCRCGWAAPIHSHLQAQITDKRVVHDSEVSSLMLYERVQVIEWVTAEGEQTIAKRTCWRPVGEASENRKSSSCKG